MRTHYPMHPYLHELADREGMLIWSEIPVYALKTRRPRRAGVRALAAKRARENIDANGNHPSVLLWSIANELSVEARARRRRAYIRERPRAAPRARPDAARRRSPSPATRRRGCQTAYAPLDVIGVNDYFGWYPGPERLDLRPHEALRPTSTSCAPATRGKALMVTEFGAEANRDGPVEEKGTYAFQQDFVNYHLGVYAHKPWLSGAIYWALNEFRVRPAWEGGNPRPAPPLHQKGLLHLRRPLAQARVDGRCSATTRATKQFG